MDKIINVILCLFSLLAFFVGSRLYGESKIKQVQSGMFVGLGLGITGIIVIRILQGL